MTSPFHHGTAGNSESNNSSTSSSGLLPRRASYATAVAGSQAQTYSSYLSQQSRTDIPQLLDSPHYYNLSDSAAGFSAVSSNDNDVQQANGASLGDRFTRSPWARRSHLPPYSKAFDSLFSDPTSAMDTVGPPQGHLVPPYLRESPYVQNLEKAYLTQLQAQKDANAQKSPLLPESLSSASVPHSKHPAYRGLNHAVVERPPPAVQGDEPMWTLPTALNNDDKYGALHVSSDGLLLRCNGSKGQNERDSEAYCIRADNFMPPQCGIYYFEMTILACRRDDSAICIGFSTRNVPLSRPPGWEPGSYGYHGDDGQIYSSQGSGRNYGPKFMAKDVIGCGINFKTNSAFFTKNGAMLGTAFSDVKGTLYPCIGLKKTGEQVRVNFGRSGFVFDIQTLSEREDVKEKIREAKTSDLTHKPMQESDLLQMLALEFLQHDGYVETAKAFAKELRDRKKNLNIDPNVEVKDIEVENDHHAVKRQHIRRAILEGDIDQAIEQTRAYYPEVLDDNEQTHFRLRCRKFIEMVKTIAELRTAAERKQANGHDRNADAPVHDTDMAMGGTGAASESDSDSDDEEQDARNGSAIKSLDQLEAEMMAYGRSMQADYKGDTRPAVVKALKDIFSLPAYTDPMNEKDVAHLVHQEGRVAVAEEVNSAILRSLGLSSRSALETIYAQTEVLLEDLRERGGPGAFVSVEDAVAGISYA